MQQRSSFVSTSVSCFEGYLQNRRKCHSFERQNKCSLHQITRNEVAQDLSQCWMMRNAFELLSAGELQHSIRRILLWFQEVSVRATSTNGERGNNSLILPAGNTLRLCRRTAMRGRKIMKRNGISSGIQVYSSSRWNVYKHEWTFGIVEILTPFPPCS